MFKGVIRGFSYSMGKLLFWVFLAVLSALLFNYLGIPKAHALENWTYDVPQSTSNPSFSTSLSSNYVTADPIVIGGQYRLSLEYVKAFTSTNLYVHDSGSLTSKHNYTYRLWGCYNIAVTPDVSTLYINRRTNIHKTLSSAFIPLSNNDYLTSNGTQYNHQSCGYYVWNFDFSNNDTDTAVWDINARLLNGSSSSKRFVYFGSELIDNGLSNSYITNQFTNINNVIGSLSSQNVQLQNGINEVQNKQDETNSNLNKIDDTLNDSSIETGGVDDLVNDDKFNENETIQNIVRLPLNFISNLNTSCQPFSLTIPFFNADVTIPCMSTTAYVKILGSALLNILKIVINGVISYRILMNFVSLFNSLKDPTNDRLEVMQL